MENEIKPITLTSGYTNTQITVDASGFTPEINKALEEKFPEDQIKTRKDIYSGLTLAFVSGDRIIDRLNKVLGNRWNFEILAKPDIIENVIIVHGRMTIDGIKKEQFGTKRITMYPSREIEEAVAAVPTTPGTADAPKKRGRKKKNVVKKMIPGGPIDLGYDYKSATTDCIKKLASLFGVALHLYSEDEKTGEIDAGNMVVKTETAPKLATPIQFQAAKKMLKKLKPESFESFDDYIKNKYGAKSLETVSFQDMANELRELNILNSGGKVEDNPFEN